MPDIVRTQGQHLPDTMQTAWREMPDGTHALERATRPVADGEVVSSTNPLPVGDIWTVDTLIDREDNDNDKIFVVPVGYEYQILSVYVEFNAEGPTGGNRQVVVEWQDNLGAVIGEVRAGAVLAQAAVGRMMFAPSMADLAVFRDTDFLMTPLPPTIFLPAVYAIRVYDNNDVDDTDNMHVSVHIAQRVV